MARIEFTKPLTKTQLKTITEEAKAKKYTQREYFEFILENYDDVYKLMDGPASRAALKSMRPLMRLMTR